MLASAPIAYASLFFLVICRYLLQICPVSVISGR